jgi:hypothetical protein
MDLFLADLSSRTSVDVQEQDIDLLLTNGQPQPHPGRDTVRMLVDGTNVTMKVSFHSARWMDAVVTDNVLFSFLLHSWSTMANAALLSGYDK